MMGAAEKRQLTSSRGLPALDICLTRSDPTAQSYAAHAIGAIFVHSLDRWMRRRVYLPTNPKRLQGVRSCEVWATFPHIAGTLSQTSRRLRSQVSMSAVLGLQRLLESDSAQARASAAYALQNLLQASNRPTRVWCLAPRRCMRGLRPNGRRP